MRCQNRSRVQKRPQLSLVVGTGKTLPANHTGFTEAKEHTPQLPRGVYVQGTTFQGVTRFTVISSNVEQLMSVEVVSELAEDDFDRLLRHWLDEVDPPRKAKSRI